MWRSAIARWERFWFEEVPSEAYALVRIALGIGGLISLIGFLPIDMFWSPDGIAPLPEGGLGLRAYIVEAGLGVWVGWAFFAFLFVSFLCMTVGLFSGAAVVACFLGSVLQSRWNSLPLTSGHTVMVATLFCLVWADCGSRLSVDAWRRRKQGLADEASSQPIWPIRLIRIQLGVMYVTSGFFKLLGTGWRSGVTVHYTTVHNIYGRFFHVYQLPDGLAWMLTALTYATLFWEIGFPLLMLHRVTRTVAILTGVGIHLGIFLTMEVGPFSWIVLAAYVAFLDPHKTPGVAAWLSRLTPARRAQPVADAPSAGSSPAA